MQGLRIVKCVCQDFYFYYYCYYKLLPLPLLLLLLLRQLLVLMLLPYYEGRRWVHHHFKHTHTLSVHRVVVVVVEKQRQPQWESNQPCRNPGDRQREEIDSVQSPFGDSEVPVQELVVEEDDRDFAHSVHRAKEVKPICTQ